MKSNKELIQELTEYFLTQDPQIVAKTLAAVMIDMNRLINMDSLSIEEKASLIARVHVNNASLSKFAKNGPESDLKLYII